MSKKEITLLIDRFLRDDLSDNELRELGDALAIPENRELFMDIMEIEDLMVPELGRQVDIENLYGNTKAKLERKSWFQGIHTFWWLKYAAIILVLLGLTFFFNWQGKQDRMVLKKNEGVVTLELGNGEIEKFSGLDNKSIKGMDGSFIGVKKGNKLYYSKTVPSVKITFNKLSVPYGKTFQLILSDGTRVQLNAGSSLRYPVNFIEGTKREVVLSGEGYFEVAEDPANPFVVMTKELDITVLGTEFNVSAYPEDQNINTVLVEGSVSLSPRGKKLTEAFPLLLAPGHRAIWNESSKNISIEPVDTEDYTGWRNGKVIFSHMAFLDICRILERHYDVSITNNNKVLDGEIFNATFDSETIEQVMASFQRNYGLKYSINGTKITID